LAYVLLDEVLTGIQLLSGMLLLVGCWIIVTRVVVKYVGSELR
jgi:hypothetical protein